MEANFYSEATAPAAGGKQKDRSSSGSWAAEGLRWSKRWEAVDQSVESACDDISIMKSTTNSSCFEHGASQHQHRDDIRPGLLSTEADQFA